MYISKTIRVFSKKDNSRYLDLDSEIEVYSIDDGRLDNNLIKLKDLMLETDWSEHEIKLSSNDPEIYIIESMNERLKRIETGLKLMFQVFGNWIK